MAAHRSVTTFMRRQGQQAWREFIDAHPEHDEYPGRFPTGYGKTESILDGYESLRLSRKRNRLLIIVPTETQLDQYVSDLERKARRMGISLTGVKSAESTPATLRYHKLNKAEVFVTTVQRVLVAVKGQSRVGNWLDDLLFDGNWVGAADEYHHYAHDDTGQPRPEGSLGWGEALRKLTRIHQWLAVSATPTRKSGSTIFGEPVVSVSYQEALTEGVVKDVAIRIRDYAVDVELGDGTPRSFTTTELREAIGTENVDAWETRRQLRYLARYCSPILLHAISELGHLSISAAPQVRPQLLVYVHSCALAEVMHDLVSTLAPGFQVNWVGTGINGRPDQENTRIIDAFKDVYDDDGEIIQPHTLDILIQVNKASEGFDSKPVCIIVDLSLGGFGPQKLQQYGRGSRHYYGMPLVIYVPTDSVIARLAEYRAGIFDLPVDEHIPESRQRKDPTEDPPDQWTPLPRSHVLDAQLIGGQDFDPTREEVLGVARYIARLKTAERGAPVHLDPEGNQDDYQLVREALRMFYRRSEQELNTEARKKFWAEKVRLASGKVARLLIMTAHPGQFDKALFKPYMQRINATWGQTHHYHDAMTDTDFRDKYNWLCDIEQQVHNQGVPAWAVL
jgi:superfamily II DNA or RNA helicase